MCIFCFVDLTVNLHDFKRQQSYVSYLEVVEGLVDDVHVGGGGHHGGGPTYLIMAGIH